MQQSLNRIAPTVRTPSGMLPKLADDAFRFDFDSAALKPGNGETRSRIAGILLASEGYRLFIGGPIDDTDMDAHNQQLSERKSNPQVNAKTPGGAREEPAGGRSGSPV